MKPLLLSLALLLTAVSANAQRTMRDIWPEVPQSILPQLSVNNRLDQIDFIDNGMRAEVRSLFDGTCVLHTLTERYLACTLGKHMTIELRLLADSTLAIVRTTQTPKAVSTLRIYDRKWRELPYRVPQPCLPDTCLWNDLPLMQMSLSPETDSLTCRYETDSTRIALPTGLLRQRKRK